ETGNSFLTPTEVEHDLPGPAVRQSRRFIIGCSRLKPPALDPRWPWLAVMKRAASTSVHTAVAQMAQDFYASVAPSLSECVCVIRRGMRVITERKPRSSKKPTTAKNVAVTSRIIINNSLGSSINLGRKKVSGEYPVNLIMAATLRVTLFLSQFIGVA